MDWLEKRKQNIAYANKFLCMNIILWFQKLSILCSKCFTSLIYNF